MILIGQAKCQVPQIEDYKALYRPDANTFLKNFVPEGFSTVSNIQALEVIDQYFLDASGKVAIPDYTEGNVNYYRKGNIAIQEVCSIWSV